jgi:hypothetical protein
MPRKRLAARAAAPDAGGEGYHGERRRTRREIAYTRLRPRFWLVFGLGEREQGGGLERGAGGGEGGRRQGAARWRWRASVTAGGGEEKGKQAGEDPYPKAELRRWLTATEERRGGNSDSGRGAAVKAAARDRVCEARRRRLRILRDRGCRAAAL